MQIYLIGDIAEFKKNSKDNTRRNLMIAGGLLGTGILGTIAVKSYLRNGKLVKQSVRKVEKSGKKIDLIPDPWDGTVENVKQRSKSSKRNTQSQQPILPVSKKQMLLPDVTTSTKWEKRRHNTKYWGDDRPVPLDEASQIKSAIELAKKQPERTRYYGGRTTNPRMSGLPTNSKKNRNFAKVYDNKASIGTLAGLMTTIQPTPENRKLRRVIANEIKKRVLINEVYPNGIKNFDIY
jgi:hypothetical protein